MYYVVAQFKYQFLPEVHKFKNRTQAAERVKVIYALGKRNVFVELIHI